MTNGEIVPYRPNFQAYQQAKVTLNTFEKSMNLDGEVPVMLPCLFLQEVGYQSLTQGSRTSLTPVVP
jgi:hypothetical protein